MQLSKRDRQLLGNTFGAIRRDGTLIPAIDGADLGVERLAIALNAWQDGRWSVDRLCPCSLDGAPRLRSRVRGGSRGWLRRVRD